jgi:hypothetical protein
MTDGKTMKPAFRVVAKVLAGIAGVVFVLPARLFSSSFAPDILVQIAIVGILGLVGLVCWHLGDALIRRGHEDRS